MPPGRGGPGCSRAATNGVRAPSLRSPSPGTHARHGAEEGTRTPTSLRSLAPQASCLAIPPPRRGTVGSLPRSAGSPTSVPNTASSRHHAGGHAQNPAPGPGPDPEVDLASRVPMPYGQLCQPRSPVNEERDTRQRPILPPRCQGSTIGAGGLNCCVRDGNRCLSTAMVTEHLLFFEEECNCALRAMPAPDPCRSGEQRSRRRPEGRRPALR